MQGAFLALRPSGAAHVQQYLLLPDLTQVYPRSVVLTVPLAAACLAWRAQPAKTMRMHACLLLPPRHLPGSHPPLGDLRVHRGWQGQVEESPGWTAGVLALVLLQGLLECLEAFRRVVHPRHIAAPLQKFVHLQAHGPAN